MTDGKWRISNAVRRTYMITLLRLCAQHCLLSLTVSCRQELLLLGCSCLFMSHDSPARGRRKRYQCRTIVTMMFAKHTHQPTHGYKNGPQPSIWGNVSGTRCSHSHIIINACTHRTHKYSRVNVYSIIIIFNSVRLMWWSTISTIGCAFLSIKSSMSRVRMRMHITLAHRYD